MDEVYFQEKQRFGPLLYVLLGGFAVVMAGIAVAEAVRVQHRAPLEMLAGSAVLIVVLAAFHFWPMATVVTKRHVSVRLLFWHRTIDHQEIVHFETRRYRPLLEYGGWGIRLGTSGWAYNARGNRGVQLQLLGGRRLLIGSQRPEQLVAAIQQAKRVNS